MADGAAEFELEDVIPAFLAALQREMHTTMPGKVVTYYPATQLADIQPVLTEGGEEHPTIPNVPIRWPSFGPFVIIGRLDPGDHVDLHFMQADPSMWRSTGQTSAPLDPRRHALSAAYATLGARPDTQPMAVDGLAAGDPITPRLVIGIVGSDVQIRINEDFIELGKGSTDFVALASKVKAALDAFKAGFDAWVTVPGDGGAALKTAMTTALTGFSSDVAAELAKAT